MKKETIFKLALPLLCCTVLTGTGALAQNELVDEIVVSATGVPTPAAQIGTSVDVITADELQDQQYVYLQDVLRQQGINVAQPGGAGTLSNVFLRGLPGRHTNLFVDGISLFDPRSNQVVWNDALVDGTRQIEIIRGSHGVLYGSNAVAGVVSQFTQIGGDTQMSARAEGGSHGTQQLGVTGQGETGRFAYGFAASYFDTDGFSTADEADGNPEKDGYDNTTLHGRADMVLTDATTLEFVVRHVAGSVEFDGAPAPTFTLIDVAGKGEDYERSAYRIGLKHEAGDWTHQIDVTGYDSQIDSIVDFAVSSSADAERQKVAYRGNVRVSDMVQLVFGAEDQTAKYTESNDYEVDVSAAFGLVQATPTDALSFTAAVRQDDHETFGTEMTYRVTAAYAPEGAAIYRAAYGTAYRAPSLSELYLPIYGNAALQPETSASAEVGADFLMSNGTEFSATVFEITIDDIIGYDPSTFVNTQVVGETKSRGAEVSLAFYPMDTLDVRLSAAYTDSKKPEASGSGDMVRELRVPRVQAGLNVSWRPRADLSIGASVRYVHDTVDFGSVELDDYMLLGVTGQWQFQEETSLFGRIENVADEDYQVVNGYGTSGRAVYVGVRRSF